MAMLSRLWPGLEIIRKYEPNAYVSAEHDIIYVGSDEHFHLYTQDELKIMDETGWFVEMEGWAHHV